MKQLADIFAQNPLEIAAAIAIILLAAAIFTKMAGPPFQEIIALIRSLAPFILKEISGKAGAAGIINVLIVAGTLILSLVVLLKPNLAAIYSNGESNEGWQSIAIVLVAIGCFLLSLIMVRDQQKVKQLNKKSEDRRFSQEIRRI